MAKLTIFFLVFFLAALSLLAFFNKDTVSLTVWKGVTFDEIPVIALLFISAAAGIISMFLISIVRDTRRHFASWQAQRRLKKDARVLDAYAKGLESLFASRYEEAEELFTGVLDYDPENVNALLRLGDVYFRQDNFSQAEEYYFKAKDIRPKSIEVLLSLQEVAAAGSKSKEAIQYLDAVLDISGDNLAILKKKRDILEGAGRWEDVIDVQQKIVKFKQSEKETVEESDRLTGYRYELGRQQIDAGQPEKAVKTLKAVFKADRNFVAAYTSLADAYEKEGNLKELKATLLKGFEETSSLVLLVRLEDYYINHGEPGAVIEIYQKALQNEKKDPLLQFFLAKLYYRLEMIDYALDTISGMDTTTFDCPELHALLGSVYERRSEFEKAAEEYGKALKSDRPIVVPFCCTECGFTSVKWSGRCPDCSSWNSLILNLDETRTAKK